MKTAVYLKAIMEVYGRTVTCLGPAAIQHQVPGKKYKGPYIFGAANDSVYISFPTKHSLNRRYCMVCSCARKDKP